MVELSQTKICVSAPLVSVRVSYIDFQSFIEIFYRVVIFVQHTLSGAAFGVDIIFGIVQLDSFVIVIDCFLPPGLIIFKLTQTIINLSVFRIQLKDKIKRFPCLIIIFGK